MKCCNAKESAMQCNTMQCKRKFNATQCNAMPKRAHCKGECNAMQCKRECNARALPTWPRLVAPSSTAPGRGVGLRATLQCDHVTMYNVGLLTRNPALLCSTSCSGATQPCNVQCNNVWGCAQSCTSYDVYNVQFSVDVAEVLLRATT